MPPNRLMILFLTARQLGFQRLSLFALYKLYRALGIYRWLTPVKDYSNCKATFDQSIHFPIPPVEFLKNELTDEEKARALNEANEIVTGKSRLFGASPVPLNLNPGVKDRHWSHFEKSVFNSTDVKFTWEPARFEWAIRLARAYILTQNENYAEAFWRGFDEFVVHNPPNCGPNWSSGQEAAIRILTLISAFQVFKDSPFSTMSRINLMGRVLASHAERIPPTLIYARSQGNNHLLTEAAGLYTAGVFLPDHPQSKQWKALGKKWFDQAVLDQIEPDGTYTQHSCNYHRLMLQVGLWMNGLIKSQGKTLPSAVLRKFEGATRWMAMMIDPVSGKVPNLGNNDGAYILPFTSSDYSDYFPIVQAASSAFLSSPVLPPKSWDEMGIWLGTDKAGTSPSGLPSMDPKSTRKTGTKNCWASIRSVKFNFRPAHADQLHVDLWAYGENICLDAGTYLYNGQVPWDNPLSQTIVHNTIQVAEQNQMLKAGRFLWLKPAQARILIQKSDEIVAEHNGYTHLGWTHRRSLKYASPDTFFITDRLIPTKSQVKTTLGKLHWLLPNWPCKITDSGLELEAPFGAVRISSSTPLSTFPSAGMSYDLIRAGESVLNKNKPVLPYLGWSSPTYSLKIPALSWIITLPLKTDTTLTTCISVHQFLTKI